MMIPTVDELRPEILKLLRLSEAEVPMAFSDEYPECLCMVVLKDVGPAKMEDVMQLLRDKSNEEMRLCANIIDKSNAYRFAGLSFDEAFELSWSFGVATVRMG
jgi:hypothetical protein